MTSATRRSDGPGGRSGGVEAETPFAVVPAGPVAVPGDRGPLRVVHQQRGAGDEVHVELFGVGVQGDGELGAAGVEMMGFEPDGDLACGHGLRGERRRTRRRCRSSDPPRR